MNECQAKGCTHLETRCVICARLANFIVMPKASEWINAKESLPDKEQEILFIAKDGYTDERIGWAYPQTRTILMRRIDIGFDDLLYWMAIPRRPDEV